MSVRTGPLKSKESNSISETSCTVVEGRNAGSGTWKEIVDLISVSATGAGFFVMRECKVGGLLSLVMPLPAHLRCYDQDKELYRVWGLVQNCHKLGESVPPAYQVGVAFIGKTPPTSYEKDPGQTYRICGMSPDGLWKITEARSPFQLRKETRFRKPINHYLAVLDQKMRTIGGERTITENISKSGAAVLTSLDVGIGERVKFICEKYDFSGIAVVCNRQEPSAKELARLHIQFVENTFPIELISLPEAIIEET